MMRKFILILVIIGTAFFDPSLSYAGRKKHKRKSQAQSQLQEKVEIQSLVQSSNSRV